MRAARFELLVPDVRRIGDTAVLTFKVVSWDDDGAHRWNGTGVFRREADLRWRLIQTHGSFTLLRLAPDRQCHGDVQDRGADRCSRR